MNKFKSVLLGLFLGSVLGYVSSLGISAGFFGIGQVVGILIGGLTGVALSSVCVLVDSTGDVGGRFIFSFFVGLPVSVFASSWCGVGCSIALTVFLVLISYFFLSKVLFKSSLKNFFVSSTVVISVILVLGLVYVKNKLPDDENALIKMMGNNDMQVSIDAAHKLLSKGKDPFIRACSDSDPKVRSVAAHFLMKFSGKDVQRTLLTTASDSDSYVRMWSAYSLGEIGDKDVVSTLVKLSKDSNENVRSYATEALGKVNGRIK
jgi:hypothetical protein